MCTFGLEPLESFITTSRVGSSMPSRHGWSHVPSTKISSGHAKILEQKHRQKVSFFPNLSSVPSIRDCHYHQQRWRQPARPRPSRSQAPAISLCPNQHTPYRTRPSSTKSKPTTMLDLLRRKPKSDSRSTEPMISETALAFNLPKFFSVKSPMQ